MNSSVDSFLAAIIASPANDTPRLVFADWLEEHGDEDRAEFIRLQISQARNPESMTSDQRRIEELLKKYKHLWEIPNISGGQFFRRGFVESLQMAAAEFVKHAERIGRSAPVVSLRLPLLNPHLEEFASISWLSRLESLDLRANNGIADRLPLLFMSTPFPHLQTLNLQNCSLWPVDLGFLTTTQLPALLHLNLSGNTLGDPGVEQLAGIPTLAGLEELVLRRDMIPYIDSIHGLGAEAIAGSPYLRRLRVLDLSHQFIGDAGFQSLIRSPNASTLESIDASHNEIGIVGDEWVSAMIASNHLGRLRRLRLAGNRVGYLGAQELAEWTHLETGCVLDLSGCEMDEGSYQILRECRYSDRIILDPEIVSV